MKATILNIENQFGALNIRVEFNYETEGVVNVTRDYIIDRGKSPTPESIEEAISQLIQNEGKRLYALEQVNQNYGGLVQQPITINLEG